MSIEMIPASTLTVECPVALRRKAFVDAAREAFFTNGYAGTTMSSIASTVGGSKTTLWSYFPSKEELFAAVVDDIVEHYGRAMSVDMPETDDIVVALRTFGRALMDTILSDQIMALNRLVLSEATRFPHLAEMFYDRGPRKGKARLAEYIQKAMDRGLLRQGNPMLAVQQLSSLCQAGTYQTELLNVKAAWDDATIDAEIDAAIDTFYRAWRPGS